jgi:hypothetical protein
MGKQSKNNNVLSIGTMNQSNETYSKLDLNRMYLPESLMTDKPQYKPKKSNYNEKENFSKKKQNFQANKFSEKINQYNDPYSYSEYKAPRKNSSGGETSCTSEECSPQNKNTKKNVLKTKNNKNKNKIPFKGEAKDFKIKYKTELCKYYEINGYCKYGDKCAYAHGKENLRSKVTNTTAYRTKKCVQFFEQGYCPYGNRCQFAHQLKSNIINNPYDRTMSYGKILETISKLENVENIKKLIEKPRLSVFEEICDNKENVENRLLEDIKGLKYKDLYERIED